ncbi:MAG: HNH endonuclease [bacterium]|nr:HNH endonuclease [bacterium]
MKGYIGVTDGDWYRFLRSHPEQQDINFWQPKFTQRFRALTEGEPFFFKLHSPHNFIVGGAYYAGFVALPTSLAWECFGEGNGATSCTEMRRQITKYRRIADDPRDDYTIGCIILSSPFYLAERNWIPTPKDFASNIVRGKGYDLTTGTGKQLWEEVRLMQRVQRLDEQGAGVSTDIAEPDVTYGDPVLMKPRIGQGSFRALVTGVYQRRCAITREKALPVLDAAHIRPISQGGYHALPNGLLFRADVHRLFDAGYVTVTPDYKFRVSRGLKDDFDNGEPYYPYSGKTIVLPERPEHRPDRQLLEWHADEVFRG